MVGDTVVYKLSASSTDRPSPCRLEGLYWQEHSAPPRRAADTATDGGAFSASADDCFGLHDGEESGEGSYGVEGGV